MLEFVSHVRDKVHTPFIVNNPPLQHKRAVFRYGTVFALKISMFSIRYYDDALCFESDAMARHKDEATQSCLAFVKRFGADSSSGIMIVFRELLTNAIEHGVSPLSPIVSVEVRMTKERRFKISVTDAGRGFDYRTLDCESEPVDPRQVTNRGYRLIRTFADELAFNEQGNSVTAYVPVSTSDKKIA